MTDARCTDQRWTDQRWTDQYGHETCVHDCADTAGRAPGALDRRTVLRGVAATGALGASASLLAACGGSGGSGGSASGSGGSAGTDLGPASEIPVGGGKVFADQKVVVTQPAKGDFKAFSAICTHQGCTVNKVADGTIQCPCHGSMYSIKDAHVVAGPAPKPLPEKQITVKGGEIRLA